ncbi:MAG: RNA polymerase sigma factor [Acidobacteria bacterium]|nr:RNA polymerase sigma factor [Acidobacteriota bacterium]MCI0622980.1 RNA polymerase sigma factor [Acidobacteriota bacterium]MCI0724977.1 RNA polymerase sigma factor [Acidobacteriota bacterium]
MSEKYSVAETLHLDGELLQAMNAPSSLEVRVTALFELLRDPVYDYLFRTLGDASEAEDLTQEVFLRLYGWLKKGKHIDNTRAWVFRVARNLALDRQTVKLPVESLDSVDWEWVHEKVEDPTPSAEHRLLEKEKQKRFRMALRRLTREEKECLDLRSVGLGYREIAEVLGMRTPTLVSFFGRVIRKLLREMYD